jgi:periplasmic protein CpxP/Spy
MMRRRISHFLDAVEATPEQRSRIIDIAGAAQRDQAAQREQAKALRERLMALLAAPMIDRSAIENLRAQSAVLRESQSKRKLQAMMDAAEVLTPAQRAAAAEMAKKRSNRMGREPERRGPGGFMRQSGEDHGDALLLV